MGKIFMQKDNPTLTAYKGTLFKEINWLKHLKNIFIVTFFALVFWNLQKCVQALFVMI